MPLPVPRRHGAHTVLTGLLDQSALYGVLAEIEALGLDLLEVRQLGQGVLGALWGLGYSWLRKTRSSVWAAMVAAVLVSRPQKVCAPWRASSI